MYNDTYIAAYLLHMRSKHDLDLLEEESKILGPNAWSSTYGKFIKSMLTQYKKLSVGQTAPDFFGFTPEEESISLYDVKGKIKLLNFWASWCNSCLQKSSYLTQIYEEFHDRGLEIVSFSVDMDKGRWLNALEQYQFPWIQLIDIENRGKASDLYVITSILRMLLLDEDNKIIGRDLQDEVLRGELEKRLGQPNHE